MKEVQFGNLIRLALNERAALTPVLNERLRAARERALDRRRPERLEMAALADNVAGRDVGASWFTAQLLLAIALLVLGFSSLYANLDRFRMAESFEIDTQLLSDDLPIDAYLDEGFEEWLKKRGRTR